MRRTVHLTLWIILIGIELVSCQGAQNSTPALSNEVILTITSTDQSVTFIYFPYTSAKKNNNLKRKEVTCNIN